MIEAVTELLEQIGAAGEQMAYLSRLQKQLEGYEADLRMLQSFGDDMGELGEHRNLKGMILADRIRIFSQYLRRLKRVIATAATMGSRPQAVLVSLQLLEQDQQRENERLEAQLMAAEEMEKLEAQRIKIRTEIARKQQIQYERDLIFKRIGATQEYAPLQVNKKPGKKYAAGLM
jgi:hypothetical protein